MFCFLTYLVPLPTLIMGFNVKTLTLSENQTSQICVAKTSKQPFTGSVSITVQSRNGTAGGEDFFKY